MERSQGSMVTLIGSDHVVGELATSAIGGDDARKVVITNNTAAGAYELSVDGETAAGLLYKETGSRVTLLATSVFPSSVARESRASSLVKSSSCSAQRDEQSLSLALSPRPSSTLTPSTRISSTPPSRVPHTRAGATARTKPIAETNLRLATPVATPHATEGVRSRPPWASTDTHMVDCRDVVSLASLGLDGSLPGESAAHLAEHVRTCRDCTVYVSQLAASKALMSVKASSETHRTPGRCGSGQRPRPCGRSGPGDVGPPPRAPARDAGARRAARAPVAAPAPARARRRRRERGVGRQPRAPAPAQPRRLNGSDLPPDPGAHDSLRALADLDRLDADADEPSCTSPTSTTTERAAPAGAAPRLRGRPSRASSAQTPS